MDNSEVKKLSLEMLTEDEMLNLFITALEGGSNYWYSLPDLNPYRAKYKKDESQSTAEYLFDAVMNHGESIKIYDAENPEEVLGEISKDNLARGNRLFCRDHRPHLISLLTENDDAETADVWFQMVVLGKLTFG